ncbi:MAG: hypothetical protein WC679_03190 [Bacteroidales bacterium]|jgi:hypothetical protein
MIDFKEKYKASKPWKKVAVFNTYSLVLALIMFVISCLGNFLFDLSNGEIYSMDYLSLSITSLAWGYIMCFLTLPTGLIKDKNKKELKNSSEIKDTETK